MVSQGAKKIFKHKGKKLGKNPIKVGLLLGLNAFKELHVWIRTKTIIAEIRSASTLLIPRQSESNINIVRFEMGLGHEIER